MRLMLGLSAGTLLSLLGGAAFAAAPPTSVLDVGAFPSGAIVAPSADAAALDAAARVVLAERAPSAKQLGFGPSRTTSLRDGRRIVKLPQMHAGLPVMHRNATVSFGADGVANIVAAKLSSDLPGDVTPSVDAATAAYAASKTAGVAVDPNFARLVIWPSGDGDRLAWHFYTPSIGLPYAPITVVDAKTGVVIAHYNAAVQVNQATVFPTNPVKSPQTKNVSLPLAAGASTLSNELVTAKNCIDTKTTKMVTIPGVPFPLTLHVCELQQTSVADGMGNFSDQPAADTAPEDPFAELHIFYHTHVAYEYFRGFDPAFKVQAGALDAVANLRTPAGLLEGDIAKAGDPNIPLEPFQNAFFAPAAPAGQFGLQSIFGITGAAMMFGQGPLKDYSYDADVIYHEFTHAVVNATIQLVGSAHRDKYGLTMSSGAMNEGLSDYFSSALSGDGQVAEYAMLDIDPSAKFMRNLEGADTCNSNIAGQVHNDSTFFAAALWDTRKGLPVAISRDFDLAIFAAMNAAPTGDLGYEDFAALAIAEVKKAATLGDAVATQLDAAFAKRGIMPECTRILEYKGETMTGPMPVQTQGGGSLSVWFGLSKTSANLGNNSLGYAPGVFQVRVPLPENTNSLTLDFEGAMQSGGGGLGGPMGSFTPKIIVRFGEEPITFSYGPFAVAEGTIAIDAEGGGEGLVPYFGTVDVPAGTKTAYVMIGNSGDADGIITNLAFVTTQSAGGVGAR